MKPAKKSDVTDTKRALQVAIAACILVMFAGLWTFLPMHHLHDVVGLVLFIIAWGAFFGTAGAAAVHLRRAYKIWREGGEYHESVATGILIMMHGWAMSMVPFIGLLFVVGSPFAH